MLSRPIEKIYLDSNVWFSYLLKKQENKDSNTSIESNHAHSLINKIISDSNTIALTRHLVILEIISIIRKNTVAKMKIHLKNTIDELTRGFIDYITKWEEASSKLQIVKVDEPLSSILKKEQKILKKNFGEIKKTTHCF